MLDDVPSSEDADYPSATPPNLTTPAVDCPDNTDGTNVPTGDCVPDAGYSGTVGATQDDPFYAVDGTNGANVAGSNDFL